jgi:hypothetical protein
MRLCTECTKDDNKKKRKTISYQGAKKRAILQDLVGLMNKASEIQAEWSKRTE